MSAERPKVYLSAYVAEIGTALPGVTKLLSKAGVQVLLPNSPIVASQESLNQVAQQIYGGDFVILLVGHKSGPALPEAVLAATLESWEKSAPGITQRLGLGPNDRPSQTQLEARLAYAFGKKVSPILCAEDFPYDAAMKETEAATQQQTAHRTMLGSLMQGAPVSSPAALLKLIRGLPFFSTPLHRRVSRKVLAMAAVAVLLLTVGALLLGPRLWRAKDSVAAVSNDPRELLMEVVFESLALDFVGSETSAQQRREDAEKRVEQRHGLAAGKLHEMIMDPRGPIMSLGANPNPESLLLMELATGGGMGLRLNSIALANKVTKIEPTQDGKVLRPFVIALYACMSQNMLMQAAELAEKGRVLAMDLPDKEERLRYELLFTLAMAREGLNPLTSTLWDSLLKEVSELPADKGTKTRLCVQTWVAREQIIAGKYQSAEALLKQTAEETEKMFGPSSMERVLVLDELAHALTEDGRYNEAGAILDQCMKIHLSVPAAENPAYATTCLRLAEVELAKSNLKVAENRAQEALDLRQKIFQNDTLEVTHTAGVECMSLLAQVLEKEGKRNQAIKLLESGMQAEEHARGPDSLPTSILRRQLAMAWNDLGSHAQAFDALKQCRNAQFSRFGDTPEYAATLDCLGVVNSDNGFEEHPYEPFTKALEILERSVGSQHCKVAPVVTHWGWTHITYDEDYHSAEPLLRQALGIEEQYHISSTLQGAETLMYLGVVISDMGRRTEAENKLQRAFDIYWNETQETVETAMAMHRLGHCQVCLNKTEEGLFMHQRANTILEDKLIENHTLRSRGKMMLAASLREAGQLQRAARLAAEAAVETRKAMGDNNFWTTVTNRVATNYVMMYLSSRFPRMQGETDEAYILRLQRFKEGGDIAPPSPVEPDSRSTSKKVTM